jgi:hypothetical protein
MNEASESNLAYEDLPYVSYEYPVRYRRIVVPGTPFVYYRGRRTRRGGRQPQVYLGTGLIGDVRPSSRTGRLICEIVEGEPFPAPLYFKDDQGFPLEPGGSRRGYYQPGVRDVDEATFGLIRRLGLATGRGNSK